MSAVKRGRRASARRRMEVSDSVGADSDADVSAALAADEQKPALYSIIAL